MQTSIKADAQRPPSKYTPDEIFDAVFEIIGGISDDDAAMRCTATECRPKDEASLRNCKAKGHYRGWMPVICDALTRYFETNYQGVVALFTRTESRRGEFLLDLAILEADSKYKDKTGNWSPSNVTRAVLGLEVEWSAACEATREADFNKLMCFTAPLKVFVYCHKDFGSSDSFNSSIRPCLENFKQHKESDHYLIIEFYRRKDSRRRANSLWWCEGRHFYIENGAVCESRRLSLPLT